MQFTARPPATKETETLTMQQMKRGDIYHADLNPIIGSEQGECRPCLVVQNNVGNEHSPTSIIVPLTSVPRKRQLPTHTLIPQSYGLEADSTALAEQIRTIDKSRLTGYIGRIGDGLQNRVDRALTVSLGLGTQCTPLELSLCGRCKSEYRDSGYKLYKSEEWQEVKEYCDICHLSKGLDYIVLNQEAG